MEKEWEKLTPEGSIMIYRILGLLLLSLLWVRSSSQLGVVLLLFLALLALARWRFNLPGWTVLLDQAACISMAFLWPQAAYGLAIPLFEAMILAKPWFGLPIVAYIIFYPHFSVALAVILLQSAIAGTIIHSWQWGARAYRQEADRERRQRYELEKLKGELLLANIQTARMAELSERNRIAQELHDDVGHELTASVLALQAFEQLWQENDPKAREMLLQARQRLLGSAQALRERVYAIKPIQPPGIDEFQSICREFTACPLHLQVEGDTARIPVYLWSILKPCLKEGLTNVIRHSNATRVTVLLDVTPHIVRLSIEDNGTGATVLRPGMGLRGLRQRAKAVGGSVTTDGSRGFRLICVLPMN